MQLSLLVRNQYRQNNTYIKIMQKTRQVYGLMYDSHKNSLSLRNTHFKLKTVQILVKYTSRL